MREHVDVNNTQQRMARIENHRALNVSYYSEVPMQNYQNIAPSKELQLSSQTSEHTYPAVRKMQRKTSNDIPNRIGAAGHVKPTIMFRSASLM